MKKEEIAQYIDHTLLKADSSKEAITKLCSEAKEFGFKSVCVHPYYLKQINHELENSSVLRCCVIGFPLGSNTLESKLFEIQNVVEIGVDELDMVTNLNAIKNKDWDYIRRETELALKLCQRASVTLKLIIESAFLDKEQVKMISEICRDLGVDFVKTSTGFNGSQATIKAVEFMKEVVEGKCQVKASGGIRDLKAMKLMIEAGADRIGTSSGVKIIQDFLEPSESDQ